MAMGALDGAVTLLTGAAGGIGVELARVLAARGARLTLTDRDPHRLADVTSRLPGATSTVVDVTDPDSCGRAVDEVLERHGRLDLDLTRLAGRPMPAPAFVEAAVHGIERDRPLVILPGRARGVALLQRLMPGVVARIGAKELVRERRLSS